jgi:phenylpropionate dioxygenase-like ring-hydroxylating dioxygenase large terminal subunit
MCSVQVQDAPASRAIGESPLRRYWHPVAAEDDVGDAPVGTTLLGEHIVLFRSEGSVHAFKDLCAHRGAKLSLGHLNGGRIVCPYHGFTYDHTGSCVYIPSQPRDAQRIPARLALQRYRCAVSCGLVWVALDEPVADLPTFPEFEDPRFRVHLAFRQFWAASAARFTENATDFSHFPYVHPGTLGDPEHPEMHPFEVERTPHGLHWVYDVRLPSSAGHLGGSVSYDTRLLFPFTVYLRATGEDGVTILFTATQPILDGTCSMWLTFARNHSFDRPDSVWTEFSRTIWDEDRRVVESQRPEELPVDLTKEVHLRAADAGGLAYRRLLEQIGLEYA